ncbi:sugar transporter family protein [Leucobacter sp. 7(1)]|uniref:MFS transporter n=1 Tax=Leucobacter sp. 7(1) TaxID=1255613 RepID=UPI00097EA12E|nr:MFS transporter [Leucobacter sp. 7(1)]SJN08369.1 sugar transporter family protein [Leucobacter sp. 7(1)]
MTIPSRLWAMLATMVFAQAATTVVTAAPAFLIPFLHEQAGLSFAEAGLLAGAPNLGLVASLVLWGAATDRWGERRVLLIGLGLTALAVGGSVALAPAGPDRLWPLAIALAVSGALAGCTNSASGRLITGWFPAERRGLAMGIRQTCQPLGMAVAAIGVPPLAAAGGVPLALALGGGLTLASLVVCAAVVRDPERLVRAGAVLVGNPYRGSADLTRIHVVSMLLVIPQFALSTFGLVWFTVGFGGDPLVAGALVAGAQFAGAGGRILVGVWSDRVRSRLRPLRQVAVAGVVVLLAAAVCGWAEWGIAAAAVYVLASCVSVADNGLAFTAVAEIAGPGWAGRALGVQNTGQFLAAAAVGPGVGLLIGTLGIPAALAITALAPVIALPLIPRERVVHPASGERAIRLSAGARSAPDRRPKEHR